MGKVLSCLVFDETSPSFSVSVSGLTRQGNEMSKLMKCRRNYTSVCWPDAPFVSQRHVAMCNKACLEWVIVVHNNRKAAPLGGAHGFYWLAALFSARLSVNWVSGEGRRVDPWESSIRVNMHLCACELCLTRRHHYCCRVLDPLAREPPSPGTREHKEKAKGQSHVFSALLT